MEITLALLADAANISQEGKLNILGVFSGISSAQAPCIHPAMAFVVRIRANPVEKGTSHRLKVRVIDDDAHIIATLPRWPFTIPDREDVLNQEVVINLSIQHMGFPRFGNYTFEISIDEQVKQSIGLIVTPAVMHPQGSGDE